MKVLNDDSKLDIIYFVKASDTLSSIANKFCVSVISLRRDNNLNNNEEVEEGDILWIRQKNAFCHIVKPVETLKDIAAQYGVTEEYIKKTNGIESIFIGQKLFI